MQKGRKESEEAQETVPTNLDPRSYKPALPQVVQPETTTGTNDAGPAQVISDGPASISSSLS